MVVKISEKDRFLRTHAYLWWGVRDVAKLSDEALLEGVLNYGEWEDVLVVFKLLGLKRSAAIFKKQTSDRKRHNYRPKTFNYFKLYFQTHVSTNPKP